MDGLSEFKRIYNVCDPTRIERELESIDKSNNNALMDLLVRSCYECSIDTVLRIGHLVKDVNDPDPHGWTVMVAICSGNGKRLDLLKAFVEEFQPDVNVPNAGGATPILLAAGNSNWEMVDYLLSQGADPTIEDECGDCANDYIEEYREEEYNTSHTNNASYAYDA